MGRRTATTMADELEETGTIAAPNTEAPEAPDAPEATEAPDAPEEQDAPEDEFLTVIAALPSKSKTHGAVRDRSEWFDARVAALLASVGRGLALNPNKLNGRIPSPPTGGETAKGLVLGLAKAVTRAEKSGQNTTGVTCYVGKLDGVDVAIATR